MSTPHYPDTPDVPSARRHPLDLVGGVRGAIEGALAPVLFVAVQAVAGAVGAVDGSRGALLVGVVAALVAGLGAVTLRLLRHESPRQALVGLGGLIVAIAFALVSGEARDFFRPGMYVDAAYGLALAGSALVGRPVVGYAWAALHRHGSGWRRRPRLRRVLGLATLGWSAVYGVRFAVQVALYQADRPDLLAVTKLLLGWPLTALGVVLTLAAVRRVERREAAAAATSVPPW